ncbi:MAG: hypothetical protein K6F84_06185, partial [Lachnospiraceae bacterium]|nr:hypothetical protein [Lachnospiraceae bacterium]
MFNLNCLNPISDFGLKNLTGDFKVIDDVNDAEGILVRSASMHEMELSDKLLCVARAGAGVNNIPLDKCAEKGIVVFMEFIRIIRNNCDMLMRLINDILEASSMGQALAIKPEKVDFAQVFDD